jgi:excisionase family DNA binding protein
MLDRTKHHNPAIQALLDYRGAAQTLAVSVRTVYTLAKAGAFPRVRIAGRTLFDPADLRAFIERSKSKSPTSPKISGTTPSTGAEGGAA